MTNKDAIKILELLRRATEKRLEKPDVAVALRMAIEALKWTDKRGIYFDVTEDNK